MYFETVGDKMETFYMSFYEDKKDKELRYAKDYATLSDPIEDLVRVDIIVGIVITILLCCSLRVFGLGLACIFIKIVEEDKAHPMNEASGKQHFDYTDFEEMNCIKILSQIGKVSIKVI